MMRAMLDAEGFEAAVAPNGRAALDVLKEEPVKPHVILLDLMMPVMDGWRFRQQQQEDPALADIPVIVVTAAPDSVLRDLSATAILHKPLDFDNLLETVRTYC